MRNISHSESTASSTIHKLLTCPLCVLITSRDQAEQIQNSHLELGFYISRQGFVFSLGNYAISAKTEAWKKQLLSKL